MLAKETRLAVVVVGCALGLTLLMTYPVVTQFASGARLDSADGQFSVWSLAWVARTIVADPLHLFDANIFHPYPTTLAYAENNIGPGVLGAPVYWLTRSPYAAHSFVLLLGFTLSVAFTFYLVRHLTGSPLAAVVPAIAFGFAPYVFGRIPHIHLVLTAGMPLALLVFHRLVEQRTAGRAIALGLVIGAVALSSGYYGIFIGLTIGFGTIFYAVSRGLWRDPRYWAAVLGAAVLSVAMVVPFLLPYFELQEVTGFSFSAESADDYAADWRAYFASPAWAHRWMLPLLETWKDVLFPGFVAAGLGLAGLVMGLRASRQGRVRETTLLYGLIGLLACWASFGPRAGLYALLYQTIPVFSLIRASSRLGVLVTLCLTVLAGFAMARLLAGRSVRTQQAWVVGLALVTVFELTSIPLRWTAAPPVAAAYEMLRVLPRSAVAEFPFYALRDDFHRHTYYMLNSTHHWQPLLNGYSNYISPEFRWMVTHLDTFPARRPFDILVERDVRYVVFHLSLYNERSRTHLLEKIETYREHLRPLVLEDDVWLYEIVNWPPPNHQIDDTPPA